MNWLVLIKISFLIQTRRDEQIFRCFSNSRYQKVEAVGEEMTAYSTFFWRNDDVIMRCSTCDCDAVARRPVVTVAESFAMVGSHRLQRISIISYVTLSYPIISHTQCLTKSFSTTSTTPAQTGSVRSFPFFPPVTPCVRLTASSLDSRGTQPPIRRSSPLPSPYPLSPSFSS